MGAATISLGLLGRHRRAKGHQHVVLSGVGKRPNAAFTTRTYRGVCSVMRITKWPRGYFGDDFPAKDHVHDPSSPNAL
jgi:hypothetical protein